MAYDGLLRHRSCRVPHYRETDRAQAEGGWYHQRKHIAADSSRTVLAPRNKHRTVPQALLQSHSYFTHHPKHQSIPTNEQTIHHATEKKSLQKVHVSSQKNFPIGQKITNRFRPHTAQLQLCFCCSFILRRTVSFSILTRLRRSSSPSPSQNSLMRSRSSVELVPHILLGFGGAGVGLAAGGLGL